MGISYHSIKLLLLVAGIVLVLGGCSKGSPTESAPSVIDGAKSEATSPATAPTTPEAATSSTAAPKAEATGVPEDTETKTASPSGSDTTDQRVINMSGLRGAVASGEISDVDALMYQLFAQFGVLKQSSRFMKPLPLDPLDYEPPPHGVFTELLMRFDDLPEAYRTVIRRFMPNESNLVADDAAAKTMKPAPVLSAPAPEWSDDLLEGSLSTMPQHHSCSENNIVLSGAFGATPAFLIFCIEDLGGQLQGGATQAQYDRARAIAQVMAPAGEKFEELLHLQGWDYTIYIQMHEESVVSYPTAHGLGWLGGFATSYPSWDPGTRTTDWANQSGVCHIWLFGGGMQDVWEATVAHELFHCFQFFKKIFSSEAKWLIEGSAMWAEHLVYQIYPHRPHTDHLNYGHKWIRHFDTPFEQRSYDAVYAFLYADLKENAGFTSGSIGAMLRASCCGPPFGTTPVDYLSKLPMLMNDFPDRWHDISVMSFNQDPPEEKLVDFGDELYHHPRNKGPDGGTRDIERRELEESTEDLLMLSLSAYSKELFYLDFEGPPSPESSRVNFDLSELGDEFQVSAFTRVDGLWEEERIDLHELEEKMFCRMKLGVCAGAVESGELLEEDIKNYQTIALIVTNVTAGPALSTISYDTYNPHLHGQWKRTAMTVDIGNPPFVVLNTRLAFDESVPGTGNGWMEQETAGYQLEPDPSTWECDYGGSYRVYMRSDGAGSSPEYVTQNENNASGYVRYIPGHGESLIPWRNICTYTASGSPPVNVSTLHVPHTSSPGLSIGFEIVDGDTLIINLPYRTYTYVRTSHEP